MRARRIGLGSCTAVLAALAGLAASSCTTQRWPAPMKRAFDPLPVGVESVAPGLDEVVVTRLSDPVRVRPAGSVGSTPLSFVDKRRRLPSGSSTYTSAGGRVEVAWPGESLIIQLFDTGSMRIGVRERGEPTAYIHQLTKARLLLPLGTTVRLVDVCDIVVDAVSAGDARSVGPLWLERVQGDYVRLFNHGSVPVRLELGSAVLSLGASQSVDLPQIGHTQLADHRDRAALPQSIASPDGNTLRWRGALAMTPSSTGLSLASPTGPADFSALGSLWHLEAGDSVVIFDDPSPSPKR